MIQSRLHSGQRRQPPQSLNPLNYSVGPNRYTPLYLERSEGSLSYWRKPQADYLIPPEHQSWSRSGRPDRRKPQFFETKGPGTQGPLHSKRHPYVPYQGNNSNAWNEQLHYPQPNWRSNGSGPTPWASSSSRQAAPEKNKKTKNQKNKKTKKSKQQKNKSNQKPNNGTDNTHQTLNQERNSPEYKKFSTLVRELFHLLRSHHHLEKINFNSSAEPPTFSRITTYLTNVVKPANITPLTKSLLEGNAKNWAYTTRLILIDHYKAHIEQEAERLKHKRAEDWKAALAVAIKWYHKRYPKKHSEGPVKNVEALFGAPENREDEEERLGETERVEDAPQEEAIFTSEDFPPLPRRAETSSPPWGTLSPFPLALPPRPPRKSRFRAQGTKQGNPVVIYPDDHREMLQIEPCPNTPDIHSLPLIHEPQVERICLSPALVEVHLENFPSPGFEGADEDPEIILVKQTDVLQTSDSSEVLEDTVLEQPEDPPSPRKGSRNLQGDDLEAGPLPRTPTGIVSPQSAPPEKFRPVKHLSTSRKMINWSLSVRKPICVLGDSNLSRITEHTFSDVQIDSYPGATFRHAENFISKAVLHTQVRTVILAFGINHRNQKCKETAVKQMQRALKAATIKFPDAAIWIPLINFSRSLKTDEQTVLNNLNNHLKKNMPHLPLLPAAQFTVTHDRIHWTPSCAKAMLEHWAKHLNFTAL